jgi:hypothetical protein
VSFDFKGRKTLKNNSSNLIGPVLALFTYFSWWFFSIIALFLTFLVIFII